MDQFRSMGVELFCDRCVGSVQAIDLKEQLLKCLARIDFVPSIHILSVKISFSRNFLVFGLCVHFRIISFRRLTTDGTRRLSLDNNVQYTLFGLFGEKITIN